LDGSYSYSTIRACGLWSPRSLSLIHTHIDPKIPQGHNPAAQVPASAASAPSTAT
jgi:hypothetical protein